MRASQKYIQSLHHEQDPRINKMKQYAREFRIPIMEDDGITFMKQLIRIHRPKKILEIGTAIGYSAIQMAKVDPSVHITTLEIDEARFQEAIKQINLFQLDDQIDAIHQDALDYLSGLPDGATYDFVFIDAAKGKNQAFVEAVYPFLRKNGLIAIDNVLFKGYVSGENTDSERLMKIGKKINAFNQWFVQQDDFETTIIETGDGIAVALKLTE